MTVITGGYLQSIRELLIGPPLPTQRVAEERLSKVQALAALSPDALASIAYANQEIFLGLVAAGAAGLVYSWHIALAIVALLGMVALSYMQTISAYPQGGGSYTVARHNLGEVPGLIAAAALILNYVLNASVSLTAGVAAVASAFPVLWPYRTALALGLLAIITLVNLRGVREAGALMVAPVYLFVAAYLGLTVVGLVRAALEGPGSYAITAPPPVEPLTLFLLLHTFSSGCTALTGVEAISNGVPAFKPPEPHNARITMAAMATLMGVLFLGTTGLTRYFGVVAEPQETILSALARRVVGEGAPYYMVQGATLAGLLVAANTSFMGFPRLASVMARDGYLPRQLAMLGDRLVFSNGITALAVLAGLLIALFGGDTHALIPLFAIGAFLTFTLSQAGMVRHWLRERGVGWPIKMAINGVGMAVTAMTVVVIGVSKFTEGAWIALALIVLMVLGFRKVAAHYRDIRAELTLRGLPPDLDVPPPPRIVLPISGVHRGVLEALRYALSISDRVTAVYVEVEPGSGEHVREQWKHWGLGVPLEIVPSPYRSVVGPLLDFLDRYDHECNDGTLASVILPEFVPAKWWEFALHNQTAWLLRLALLYRRRRYGKRRAIIDVPMYLRH